MPSLPSPEHSIHVHLEEYTNISSKPRKSHRLSLRLYWKQSTMTIMMIQGSNCRHTEGSLHRKGCLKKKTFTEQPMVKQPQSGSIWFGPWP